MRATTALTLVSLGLFVATPALAQYSPPSYYSAPSVAPSYDDSVGLRHGGLAILFLGANIPVGSGANDFSAGGSAGAILGGHLNPNISLNGELTVHVLNNDHASFGQSEYIGDITFSPLYHFGQGNVEFAVGPKLGFFSYHLSYDDGYDTYDAASASGVAYGFNAAVFTQLWPAMSLGGVLSFTSHHATKWCYTDVYGVEDCASADADDLKVLTISAALRW